MAKKIIHTPSSDTQDITKLMDVFTDTHIENIDEYISATEDQFIQREVESVKTTANAGDIDKANDLLWALLNKFPDNQKLFSQKKDLKQHISSKKIDAELQEAVQLYEQGKYQDAKKILTQMSGDFSASQQKLGKEFLNKVNKKIEEHIDSKLQETKALYDTGKYDKAISLLETINPVTQQQDELKDEYHKLFTTKQQEAEQEAKEQKLQLLITSITTNTKAGDIQAATKSLEELQTVIGRINGQEDMIVDSILEILTALFQQLGNAIIEGDTNTFHNILEHSSILARHPIIAQLKKIVASDSLEEKQTIKEIKILLDISTPLFGKSKIRDIDDLIVPAGKTTTSIVRMIMKKGHVAVSFLTNMWTTLHLKKERQRAISHDGRYIDMYFSIEDDDDFEKYIDERRISISSISIKNIQTGIDTLTTYLKGKHIISRKSDTGKRRLEIID